MLRVFFVFLFLLLPVWAESYDEYEWGSAHNLFIKKTINERWSILSRSLFTTRDDFDDTFFATADLGVGYSFSKKIRASVAYRHAWFRPGDEWLEENRPLINLSIFQKWGAYRITNRSRMEFRFFDYKDDDLRFRNELRIETPWQIPGIPLKPYFEEEFFFSKNAEKIDMNWLTAGLYYKPAPRVKLKCGYRWYTQELGGEWRNRHMLVTAMNFYY